MNTLQICFTISTLATAFMIAILWHRVGELEDYIERVGAALMLIAETIDKARKEGKGNELHNGGHSKADACKMENQRR